MQDVLKAKCISRCLHRCIMITNLHSSPQHSLHLTSPFIGNVQLPSSVTAIQFCNKTPPSVMALQLCNKTPPSVMALQFCNETPPSVMALQLCNKTPPSVMVLQLCDKTPQSNHPRTVVISGWVHHYPLGYTHHIWKYSCILKIVTGVRVEVLLNLLVHGSPKIDNEADEVRKGTIRGTVFSTSREIVKR